jgi:NADP-dependent 3-hydroxy acid dehydrogenase YdfG
MKQIKLTGRSSGLAKILIEHLSSLGYEVQGYGKGDIDLENTTDVIEKIKDADIFINNANHKFTQAEILFELFNEWKDDPEKMIINISSRAAQPNISKGYLYAAQKAALDHLANNLVYNTDGKKCRITTISLGLLNKEHHALSYHQVAATIATLIGQPQPTETVHLSIQHSSCYQEVQALKASKIKTEIK